MRKYIKEMGTTVFTLNKSYNMEGRMIKLSGVGGISINSWILK